MPEINAMSRLELISARQTQLQLAVDSFRATGRDYWSSRIIFIEEKIEKLIAEGETSKKALMPGDSEYFSYCKVMNEGLTEIYEMYKDENFIGRVDTEDQAVSICEAMNLGT